MQQSLNPCFRIVYSDHRVTCEKTPHIHLQKSGMPGWQAPRNLPPWQSGQIGYGCEQYLFLKNPLEKLKVPISQQTSLPVVHQLKKAMIFFYNHSDAKKEFPERDDSHTVLFSLIFDIKEICVCCFIAEFFSCTLVSMPGVRSLLSTRD